MSTPSTIQYTFPHEKGYFAERCREVCASNEAGEYLFESVDEAHIRIGVGRGGHGGYWYEATLTDTADGYTAVEGRIRYYTSGGICSEDVPYTRREKVKDTIKIVLLLLLLWPIVLPVWLFFWIVEKKNPTRSPTDALDHLMVERLCCHKDAGEAA